MDSINVLCVDAYNLMLLTVQHMLEFEGWRVESCRDGSAALERIESSERFDVIILSERLPNVGGLELLRRTRELAHRRRTPVILFASTNCERQAYAAGADAVLQKPNDIKFLAETVARCLRGRATREKQGPDTAGEPEGERTDNSGAARKASSMAARATISPIWSRTARPYLARSPRENPLAG